MDYKRKVRNLKVRIKEYPVYIVIGMVNLVETRTIVIFFLISKISKLERNINLNQLRSNTSRIFYFKILIL
jgi:hypothetical protein